jgi:predicted DNA binding CopG/RHH family protein
MKKNKPQFKNEDEERVFWSKVDSTDYIDWKKAKSVNFPNLQPSVKTISVRLPEIMLEELKFLAHKQDVPYQSLLKIFLAQQIKLELKQLVHS